MGTLVMELDLLEKELFHFLVVGYGQNVKTFGADMSSSLHIDHKKRHINIGKRSNARARKYFYCRKDIFY